MRIKSLASSALSLAFASVFLLPVPAQATDDCDIFSNPACELYPVPNVLFMQFPGQEIYGSTHSITLSNPQTRVAARLITPGEVWFSQNDVADLSSQMRCEVDEETYFSFSYSTLLGVRADANFQGQSQATVTSVTPHGEYFLVAASFAVPQLATLSAYSCFIFYSESNAEGSGSGDGWNFNLELARTFTPTTPSTTTPSTTTPSTTTPSASTPSASTPSASSSPRVTSSPSPSASTESNDEEGEVDTRSSEVVVSGTADSESGGSPIGFLAVGILSALAGIGATVAFIQRKAIIRSLAKFKKPAKP